MIADRRGSMDDLPSRMPRVTLQRLGLAMTVLVLLNFFLSFQDVVKVEIHLKRRQHTWWTHNRFNTTDSPKSDNKTSSYNHSQDALRRKYDTVESLMVPTDVDAWKVNSTEVLHWRRYITQYFNPEKDFTVLKSEYKVGDTVKYEVSVRDRCNITEELHQNMPEVNPLAGKLFRTCSVVGNSGILLNSGCGRDIDSADFVIRCNLAKTLPYVHDVGIKHGLTTMNPSVMAHDYRYLDQNATVKARFVDRLRQLGDSIFYQFAFVNKNGRDYMQWTNEIIVNESLPLKSVFPPRTCNGKIRKVWSRTREFQFKRPSSGMYMITVALTICDEIHVYGYFPFKEDHRGTRLRYHYYDHRRYSTGGLHAMPKEFRALRLLHDRGVLRLHNDRCRP
ncbi:CMP-N-acetylneuraminate-poly-alpha-2,8-sialyltransferase-like [Branchiostoma lanceolatum]|uniref:CMP-N-acetylneuraminate-poly-alpha-2, 8-sialyltransferase-like n=1 Tax=Branchiostoma lanceolatum TaxID=7740 RepID=UPI0034572CB2